MEFEIGKEYLYTGQKKAKLVFIDENRRHKVSGSPRGRDNQVYSVLGWRGRLGRTLTLPRL